RIRTHDRVVSDEHRPEHLCASTNVHPIPKPRGFEAGCHRLVTESHALADDAIVADDAVAVDDDAVLVLQDDPPAERHGVWQLDAIGAANSAKHRAIENAEGRPKQLGLDPHSPLANAVDRNGAKSGLGPIAAVSDPILANEL